MIDSTIAAKSLSDMSPMIRRVGIRAAQSKLGETHPQEPERAVRAFGRERPRAIVLGPRHVIHLRHPFNSK